MRTQQRCTRIAPIIVSATSPKPVSSTPSLGGLTFLTGNFLAESVVLSLRRGGEKKVYIEKDKELLKLPIRECFVGVSIY